ncbi:hypothetical protein C1645_826294 [Glomus cerebriforme]|uniref:Uncharacterized protein n=1 Tax=Glomus cerebriforme TaxID=658196 RepID=A0A397SWX1_9GLOM|nr:hypothetical protein C1645_826294 [Glomus cerebriforme]
MGILNVIRTLQFSCGLICLIIDALFLSDKNDGIMHRAFIFFVCVDAYCMLINGYIIAIEHGWNKVSRKFEHAIYWLEICLWISYIIVKLSTINLKSLLNNDLDKDVILYFFRMFYLIPIIVGGINLFLSIIYAMLIRKSTFRNNNAHLRRNNVNNVMNINNAGAETNNAGAEYPPV